MSSEMTTEKRGRGAKNLSEQIAGLEAEAGPSGIERARKLISKPENHVIVKLAARYLSQESKPAFTEITKSQERLLEAIHDPKDRETMRALFIQARKNLKMEDAALDNQISKAG